MVEKGDMIIIVGARANLDIINYSNASILLAVNKYTDSQTGQVCEGVTIFQATANNPTITLSTGTAVTIIRAI